MNSMSDTVLVGRAALGDRQAFDALVSRHALPLRRYLLRLTGDPPLADDLAQETFIKAYCRIGTFGGLAGFRTWLFRIGYNAFCSYRRGEHEAAELDDSLPADEGSDPDTGTRCMTCRPPSPGCGRRNARPCCCTTWRTSRWRRWRPSCTCPWAR